MNSNKIYIYSILVILIIFTWLFLDRNAKNEEFTEITKISLRSVGHQLLLANKDTTSLVLPVKVIDKTKFNLSFGTNLSFNPNDLVTIIQQSFEKASLPENYRVEVIQCEDNETAYSYEMKLKKEKSIVPCRGRFLPNSCYTIQIKFINKVKTTSLFNAKSLLFFLVFILFIFLLVNLFKRKQNSVVLENNENLIAIGSFQFYPEQHKLVKEAVEINLSKKECEILAVFVARPNQIIKREELMKKVWEDNGIFVGRSLDTYISKLRKKLKADDKIQLINIHGVGYKLKVN